MSLKRFSVTTETVVGCLSEKFESRLKFYFRDSYDILILYRINTIEKQIFIIDIFQETSILFVKISTDIDFITGKLFYLYIKK